MNLFKFKLLLKEHEITGLKYLCVTSSKKWWRYNGSGTYWKKHLLKHGTKIFTTVLFSSDNRNELDRAAEYYSHFYDVVNSAEFANQIHECGYSGQNNNLAHWCSLQTFDKLSEIHKIAAIKASETVKSKYNVDMMCFARRSIPLIYGVDNIMKIESIAELVREKQKETLLMKYGVDHNMKIPGIAIKVKNLSKMTMMEKYGVEHPLQIPGISDNVKLKREQTLLEKYGVINISQLPEFRNNTISKIKETLSNREPMICPHCGLSSKNHSSIKKHIKYCKFNPNREIKLLLTCPYCNKEVDSANSKRWHFDNCKLKGN